MVLPLLALLIATAGTGTLEVDVDGLRNGKGSIQACVTRDRKHFPDCKSDPAAVTQTVPTNAHRLTFAGLPPGEYAVALFHDENANSRFDTMLGIPREGFGFSRSPVVRFGAPRFDKVSMQLGPGFTRIRVRIQYLL
jgi:uncharacterized protein (DUF2141 family)